MSPHKMNSLLSTSLFVLCLVSTEAWIGGGATLMQNHVTKSFVTPQSQYETRIHCGVDDDDKDGFDSLIISDRRKFLCQSSVTAAFLSSYVNPPLALAQGENATTTQDKSSNVSPPQKATLEEKSTNVTTGTETKDPISSAKVIDTEAKEVTKSEKEPTEKTSKEKDLSPNKKANDVSPSLGDEIEDLKEKDSVPVTKKSSTPESEVISKKVNDPMPGDGIKDSKEEKTEAKENIVSEEKKVIAEIAKEENIEDMALEDINKLIAELEEQLKEQTMGSKPEPETMETTKNLIETVKKEEEEIKSETKELISKIETLGSETEDFKAKTGDSSSSSDGKKSVATETPGILNKLKDRVEEEEDLITRLKRQSEKDIDPRTGKFRTMTSKEFERRVPSNFDFLEYLKESITNTKEFEQDLDAFKGLLEKDLESVEEGVRNAEKHFFGL